MIAFLLMSEESKKFFSEITLCCAIKHLYFNNYLGIKFGLFLHTINFVLYFLNNSKLLNYVYI